MCEEYRKHVKEKRQKPNSISIRQIAPNSVITLQFPYCEGVGQGRDVKGQQQKRQEKSEIREQDSCS